MDDLISRKALIEELQKAYDNAHRILQNQYSPESQECCRLQIRTLRRVIQAVKEAPAIDADPVRHGGTTWDVFDDLASSYYEKQMYFTQPDGTIYSRLSCGYMTFEEALAEFREAIGMDGGKKDETT